MIKDNNKKGAVEMSISLIIMLVIGLTVLGLIISFVTGFLGKAQNSFSGKISEDDKIQLDKVKNEPGNFVVTPKTLLVKKGSKTATKLFMKVRNPTSSQFSFTPQDGKIDNANLNFQIEITKGRNAGDIYPIVYGPPISLDGGSENAYPIEVFAGTDVDAGTYYVKFSYTPSDNSQAYEELVTVNVE